MAGCEWNMTTSHSGLGSERILRLASADWRRALAASCAPALLSLAACGAVDGREPQGIHDLGSSSDALTKVYEAESALVSGPSVLSTFGGFTGTGYVDYQAA